MRDVWKHIYHIVLLLTVLALMINVGYLLFADDTISAVDEVLLGAVVLVTTLTVVILGYLESLKEKVEEFLESIEIVEEEDEESK